MKKAIRHYLKECIFIIIYSISIGVYIFFLKRFNIELEGLNPIEIMLYKNGNAWLYLIIAIIISLLDGVFLFYLYQLAKVVENIKELGVLLVLTIILLLMLGLVIIFINNPILRAACAVLFIGGFLLKN